MCIIVCTSTYTLTYVLVHAKGRVCAYVLMYVHTYFDEEQRMSASVNFIVFLCPGSCAQSKTFIKVGFDVHVHREGEAGHVL